VRTHKVTSLALTQMYLARLKRYDSKLHFVISLTEERALAQAKAADAEIAAPPMQTIVTNLRALQARAGRKDSSSVRAADRVWVSPRTIILGPLCLLG